MASPSPDSPQPPAAAGSAHRSLPRSIWVLGMVSMFMDISSELVHSLLPIFMTSVLGASMLTIGIIEGVSAATAAVTKVFSGAISDFFRRRKFLVVLGYSLSALTKPVFPLAPTVEWVFGARFVDRIGKGIRGAPRDALVADIVPPRLRGAAYGLRQSLDSVGAFLGPLLAVLFMLWLAGDVQLVLWVAVVPALIAMLLTFTVHEPTSPEHPPGARKRLTLAHATRLPLRFWLVVALGAVFILARFSEAFLILRAQDVGLTIAYVPAIMIIMNIVYAGFAYPAGIAADRLSSRALLLLGLAALIVADIILAMALSSWAVFLGAACWGLHMALTQGLLSKLVADNAPAELRGTAFGIFNLVSGGALLLASIIAGTLWSLFGAPATFIAGASFAAVAAAGLLLYRPATRTAAGGAAT
ncbi:MFS transporter [Halomonas salipaludis]|uniref:MFS transporter n=1 Tax=Halomonas salipaludis TaxID=2032625 RepID=A0A2A2ESC7_9GAMM|nr:MFS transporter [Halomonas salipaludis]PAU75289.1 MFS transporter [Halomonas salipaludis]